MPFDLITTSYRTTDNFDLRYSAPFKRIMPNMCIMGSRI
jgi:hypothetical protein